MSVKMIDDVDTIKLMMMMMTRRRLNSVSKDLVENMSFAEQSDDQNLA